MSLPVCRPRHRSATALYVVPDPAATTPGHHILRTEPVTVRDEAWMVKRDGKVVALDTVSPLPDALQFAGGTVENGAWRCWPDLAAFLRAHGIDPDTIQQKEEAR